MATSAVSSEANSSGEKRSALSNLIVDEVRQFSRREPPERLYQDRYNFLSREHGLGFGREGMVNCPEGRKIDMVLSGSESIQLAKIGRFDSGLRFIRYAMSSGGSARATGPECNTAHQSKPDSTSASFIRELFVHAQTRDKRHKSSQRGVHGDTVGYSWVRRWDRSATRSRN